ncbi:hypothetical protein B9Z19DRAFT_1064792 [Tuber borchii]|uniref:Uncharacterized protein n=1 Tax=Tuber borchii TaxID=42251 RepID=A0A2T6ZTH1_TUBBO|nr:hypothetical protein B9Z19DRAFT_1064792 [Tuber borchii]
MPNPADSANLFVKNFDEDFISDPDELKKLLELYGPGEDEANAKVNLNGSIVGKKRLFVTYAERNEELTQRLKLHIKWKDGFRRDGKESDRSNPDSTNARSSDNGEDGSTEGTQKGEKVSIEKEPLSPPLEKSPNRREDGFDQDAIRESPEVSLIDEGSEQGSSTTGALTIDDRPPLTPVENVPHIMIEQDTTSLTGWHGSTQLTGSKFSHLELPLVSDNANYGIEVTEVDKEDVSTETTYGDNIAAYAEPTLPQIHGHVMDDISGQVQESDFHDQIREEMLQSYWAAAGG